MAELATSAHVFWNGLAVATDERPVILMHMAQLGVLVSTHPVDNRRRWVIAIQAGVAAVVTSVLLAALVAHPAWSAGKLVGLLMVVIATGFPVAAVQAFIAARGGLREQFDVYEDGIVHTTKNGQRAWTWHQVALIRRTSSQRFPRNGWNFGCAIKFSDGAKIRFNGLTTDAVALADTLTAARPDTVTADDEFRRWRLLRWVMPFVAAGCGWCIVTVITMLNDDEITVEIRPGYSKTVPRFDDSTIALLAVGSLVCVVIFVLSLSYLVVGLVAQARRRSNPAG